MKVRSFHSLRCSHAEFYQDYRIQTHLNVSRKRCHNYCSSSPFVVSHNDYVLFECQVLEGFIAFFGLQNT